MNLAKAKKLCRIASKTKDPVAFLATMLPHAKSDYDRAEVWLAHILLTGHEPPIQRTPQWKKIEATVRAFISKPDSQEWLRVHAHDQQPVIKMVQQISHGKIHTRNVGSQEMVHVPKLTQDYDIPHPSNAARAQMVEWRKKHGMPYVGSKMVRAKARDHGDGYWESASGFINNGSKYSGQGPRRNSIIGAWNKGPA